jgi:hypothetical protein
MATDKNKGVGPRGCHPALSWRLQGPFRTKVPAALWSSQSQLAVNSNLCITDDILDMKKHNFDTAYQNGRTILIWGKNRESRYTAAVAYWNSTNKDMNQNQKEILSFRNMKLDWSTPPLGIYLFTRPLHIGSKGKSCAGNRFLAMKRISWSLTRPQHLLGTSRFHRRPPLFNCWACLLLAFENIPRHWFPSEFSKRSSSEQGSRAGA